MILLLSATWLSERTCRILKMLQITFTTRIIDAENWQDLETMERLNYPTSKYQSSKCLISSPLTKPPRNIKNFMFDNKSLICSLYSFHLIVSSFPFCQKKQQEIYKITYISKCINDPRQNQHFHILFLLCI